MRIIDWPAQRARHASIASDAGQWLGLLDEDGIPLLDLPQVLEMDWPEQRGVIESVELKIRVRTPSGRLHAIARELIAENLGLTDEQTALIPITGPARFVALERPGLPRRVMRVSHVEVDGDTISPIMMKIHGTELLGYLELLPSPSTPTTWTGAFTRFTRDWVGPQDTIELFEHPRDLADIKLMQVADGGSVEGAADIVLHRLIDESLEAVLRMAGITSDPPYIAVLLPSDVASPYTILRPTDQTIWAEVGDEAMLSGVAIRAHLWWPGDDQPAGRTLRYPTIVFTVRQEV